MLARYIKNRLGCPVKRIQYEGKKRIRTRESSEFKICTGWTFEWTSPNRIRKNKGLNVREVVRGPFVSPKLLKTHPFLAVSSCYAQDDLDCIRHGIPDTWRENLASRGYCGVTEARVQQKNLISRYVSCLATDRLWNELGLPFAQGIPDPWKCRSFPRGRCIGHSRRRNTCNRKTSTRIASNYDGDDEAEIEHSAKSHCQFNEQYVDGKKDLSQDGTQRKLEDTLKKIKKNKEKIVDPSRRRELDTVTKEPKKMAANIRETRERITSRRKEKANLNTNAEKATEYVQTVQIRKSPNTACCNCKLQNYVDSNVPCRKATNVSECVLCQNCENVYRQGCPQRLDFAARTVDFCVPDPSNVARKRTISKRARHKLCVCFQKARHRIEQLNGQNYVNEKDMELVCCQCNCPYLKIASIYANVIDRNTRPCALKKSPNGPQEKQNTKRRERRKDRVSECPAAWKQRSSVVHDSENCRCTYVENKTVVSKRGLEQASHSTNDATIVDVNEIPKENSRGDDNAEKDVFPETMLNDKTKRNDIQMSFHDDAGNDKIIVARAARRLPKNPVRRRWSYIATGDEPANYWRGEPRHDYFSGRARYKLRKGKKVKDRRIDGSTTSVSDNDENADISDNIANVAINIASKENFDVTSMTFIRRLNNAVPSTRLYRKKKLKKCVLSKPRDQERTLDRAATVVANKNRNESFPTDFRNNARAMKQTVQLMNPIKNHNARKSRRRKTLKQKLY
ncbi:uncharacterized protein LOC143344981 [Colletes latitarsis]|uniref:uncharacterized protein LOC143344981 n=1 Tax=Colletes latitarsis TaxID=2605962 RepID=UPI0040372122